MLETCPETPKQLSGMLSAALSCDTVQVIGRRIVLYRQSSQKPVIALPQ